jgi:hemolysin III
MEQAPTRGRAHLGEEIANSISHGVGLFAALVGTPVLIVVASHRGAAAVVGSAVFAAALVVLYASSTLYHALPGRRAKRVFRVLDHSGIFIVIAGTYTPFTLTILPPAWGWSLFGVIWGLAVAGIVLKAVGLLRHQVLSTSLYLAMGWLALIAIRPITQHLPAAGLAWILAGGALYTAGIPFFAATRVRYAHFVWHLFVLAGTTCHYVAVLRYAA